MATVADLYRQYLGREPDAGGLSYWTQAVKSGPTQGIDPEEITAFLAAAKAAGEEPRYMADVTTRNVVEKGDEGMFSFSQAPAYEPPARQGDREFEGQKYFEADRLKILEQLKAQQAAGMKYTASFTSDEGKILDDLSKRLAAQGVTNLSDLKPIMSGETLRDTGEGQLERVESTQIGLYNSKTGEQLSMKMLTNNEGKGTTNYQATFVNGIPVFTASKAATGLEQIQQDFGPILSIAASAILPGLSIGGTTLGNLVGSSLGLTGTAASTVGNALVAGLGTGAVTGDAEKALLASALVGGGTFLNQTGVLGDVFDKLGLSDLKDTFGVTGGTGAVGATTGVISGAAGTGALGSGLTAGGATLGGTTLGGGTTGALGSGLVSGGATLGGTGTLGTTLGSGLTAGGTVLGGTTLANTLGTGAGTALGTNLLGQTLGQVGSNLLGGLFGGQLASSLPGILGAGVDYAQLSALQREAEQLGASQAQRAEAFGQQAQVPFTPYTVTTGAGTGTIGPGQATATASPAQQAIRDAALQQSLASIQAINPAQAAETLYGQIEALAAPGREREQLALQQRLQRQGLMGFGTTLPTTGGGARTVNPLFESLLSAQESARAQQALQAQQFGTTEAGRLQQLAAGLQQQGQAVTAEERSLLSAAQAAQAAEQANRLANANRLFGAQMSGLALRSPYEQIGLAARGQAITGAGSATRGILGLPTSQGNVQGNLLGGLLGGLFNQGFDPNAISSGLDISGNSQATQNLINDLQRYGIF